MSTPRILTLLAFSILASVMPGVTAKSGPIHAGVASLSAMPKGPSWQRPAPTTWSSKPNVRWEARFGLEGRYIA